MRVVILRPVAEFLDALEAETRADIRGLIRLLEMYGHELPMPYAKPLGGGLRELRYTGRPHVRILYGFWRGSAVLVHALVKKRSALRQQDILLARKRFDAYCT